MNKKHCILTVIFALLPVLSFATTGDTTFNDITTQIKAYLGGSLGLTFVLIGFLGAGAAIAGFAPMKIMFPVFGLTLALHYGPKILENIFSATGEYDGFKMHYGYGFDYSDLAIILAAASLFILGTHKKRINKESK